MTARSKAVVAPGSSVSEDEVGQGFPWTFAARRAVARSNPDTKDPLNAILKVTKGPRVLTPAGELKD